MNREQYLESIAVREFIVWFSERCETIEVSLKIRKSAFVSAEIDKNVVGLPAVVNFYSWKSKWSFSGQEVTSDDWRTTMLSLAELRKQLIDIIFVQKNRNLAYEALRAVFQWGGGSRNLNVGAQKFLETVPDICDYIQMYSEILRLDSATIDPDSAGAPAQRFPPMMNAMLTKVHSLVSPDGLPIYDSRVGGAIASLVAVYCAEQRQINASLEGVPRLLQFPMTERNPRRSVPEVLAEYSSFFINRESDKRARSAAQWTSAKIRLGWIMQMILDLRPSLFSSHPKEFRMRAFEAALFMIGYDTGSIVTR
jgi:hypothetical protein